MTTQPNPASINDTEDVRVSTETLLDAISKALGPGITSITFADPNGVMPERRYELTDPDQPR